METSEKTYAEMLRETLTALPVKKKCCAHSIKDANEIAALPPHMRPGAILSAAARCKCPACLPQFIARMFLLYGSVTDPSKRNHLEFAFETEEECNAIETVLAEQGIIGGRTKRKQQYILYLKNGEVIADFFAYIGANTAAFDFMNSRIEREFRNNINRQVNCDTANIKKTLSASESQIAVIHALEVSGKTHLLPTSLQETARLRLLHRQMSLKELGNAHNPPITKSGVNHRIAKIIDFAKSLDIH